VIPRNWLRGLDRPFHELGQRRALAAQFQCPQLRARHIDEVADEAPHIDGLALDDIGRAPYGGLIVGCVP